MAGVALLSEVRTQIALAAQLRWRLFWNSLGISKGRLELASRILLLLLWALFALGIGFALGAAAYLFTEKQAQQKLEVVLWAVFAAWQLFPLFTATASAPFDFRDLLRLPLRFPAFFLLSLSPGLFDSMLGLVWLTFVGTGISLARPRLLPAAFATLGVFAALNMLLSRAIFTWLDQWLARRRTREILGVVFLLGMVFLQLFGPLGGDWGRDARSFLQILAPVQRLLPPGLAASAIVSAGRGRLLEALGGTALLALYGVALALLLAVRLCAQYRGEDLSESTAPRLIPTSQTGRAGWRLPGSSGPVTTIVEKEFRCLFRSSPIVLNLAMPLILAAFFAMSFRPTEQRPEVFIRAPEMAYPIAVGYALLVLSNLPFDSFAFEGRGIQLLFLAPVRFRDILLAKNLAHALVIFLEATALYLLVGLLFAPPGALIALSTFAALLFALLVNFSVGNFTSLRFPRRMEPSAFGRQRHSGVTILSNLIVQIVVLAVAAFVFLWTRGAGLLWTAAVFVGLSVAMLPPYAVMLSESDHIAVRWREGLLAELGR